MRLGSTNRKENFYFGGDFVSKMKSCSKFFSNFNIDLK